MRSGAWLVAASALAVTTVAKSATAQSIASRIDAVRDGTLQMVFATRPGVCGDGRGGVSMQDGIRTFNMNTDRQFSCVPGPEVVTVGRADGQTVSIRQCVACRPRPDGTSLGEVPASEAARYLLSLARSLAGRNADDAISAAAFADAGNLAPEFKRLIQDESATTGARKQALFWFGQTGESAQDLVDLDASLQGETLRDQYTFVLSQRRDDSSLHKLIDIARRDPSSHVRKQAMFWLGQSRDPQAIQFFKDILWR